MKTLCVCGHPKSQHPEGICDYRNYSCQCTGYKRRTETGRITNAEPQIQNIPLHSTEAQKIIKAFKERN